MKKLTVALGALMCSGTVLAGPLNGTGTFYEDTVVEAKSSDVTFYRVLPWTATYNNLFGKSTAVYMERNTASSAERSSPNAKKKKDPVWMFDVLALDYYDDLTVGEAVGETIKHALVFCVDKDVKAKLQVSVTGGPESWKLNTGYDSLPKGCYAATINGKDIQYKKPGRYIFKGGVIAKGFKMGKYNTDTFKYWVVSN